MKDGTINGILGREIVSTFWSVRSEVRIATEKDPEKEIKGTELVLRGVSGVSRGGSDDRTVLG